MNNNETTIKYDFPKFDPMTCTIDELIRHWQEYTVSEYIWNEVRDDIYKKGTENGIDKCLQIVQKIKDDYNDAKFGEQVPINYGTICGIIIALEQLKENK